MKNEKDNLLKPVNKEQITKILETLSDIYTKINGRNGMKDQTGEIGRTKTFALGGRFLGDIGECLASYLFDAKLCKTQKPGYDGRLQNGIRTEIKVRTTDKNEQIRKIHISKESFNPGPNKETKFYLIIFSFNFKKKQISIALNKSVPTNSTITEDRSKSFKAWLKEFAECADGPKIANDKLQKIAGWTIVQ